MHKRLHIARLNIILFLTSSVNTCIFNNRSFSRLHMCIELLLKGMCHESERKCASFVQICCITFLSLSQLTAKPLLCVKNCVKVCMRARACVRVCMCLLSYIKVQHKHAFSCLLGSSRGPFKRSLKFLRKNRMSKIVSVCRSIPAKCTSSVFSSQLCHLSNWGFLCVLKLLGFKHAVCVCVYCMLHVCVHL